MRKVVFILFIGIFLFAINIVFYSMSEDYRFFIKKIKYSDTVVYDNTLKIDDKDTLIVVNTNSDIVEDIQEEQKKEKIIKKDSIKFLEELKKEEKKEEKLSMNENEKDFLQKFKDFSLRKLEKKASLFDITTEYPDEYFEYFSENISLYFFSTKTYKEVFDIFEVLSEELPYSINEVHNFGQASFYINLEEIYEDNSIRIVMMHENNAFGLKINKDMYNSVKEVLKSLKPQG